MSSSATSGAGSVRTHGVPSEATNNWSSCSTATSPPGARFVLGQPPTPVSPHTTVIRTAGYRPASHSSDTRSVPAYVGCSNAHRRANDGCPDRHVVRPARATRHDQRQIRDVPGRVLCVDLCPVHLDGLGLGLS